MKTYHPTTQRPRRKRRAADEAATLAEHAEAASAERGLELLRRPEASPAVRVAALAGLQRAVGNGAVERMLGLDVQRLTEQVQRKGAKKKKAPGTTVIHAPRQSTYEVEASTLAEAAAAIGEREEAGLTEWDPRLSYQTDENGVVTSATVTVTPTVTMPHWPGSGNLSRGGRAEWQRFYRALAHHEQGHVDLIHEHMAGLGARLVGKTPEEAQATFDEAVQALQAASNAYDERTDHGRNNGTIINTDAE